MNEVSDYEDCGCGKCCLPTIVAERDDAIAEVRRLREELATKNKVIEYGELFKGPQACARSGCELPACMCVKHGVDEQQSADLARAIELLKRDHWSRRAADCACDTCTFLAEMGKR